MDLKQIEYFVRVAERRSFSRAAELLDVAQPTLSRQVRLLELELGQHLLYRNGRGAEPTEAGLRFLEHARALLALADRAKQDLQTLRETPTGKVVVGLPPRIARVLTPPLVQAFRRRFPDASIAVAEGLSAQMREWLLAGRVDLALLYDPAPSPQLGYESLFRENLVLVAAADHQPPLPARIAVAGLGAYPLVLPSLPNAIRTLVESICRAQGVRLQVAAESTRCRPSWNWPPRATPTPSCRGRPRGARRPSTRCRSARLKRPASPTTWCSPAPATAPPPAWPAPPAT